MAPPFFSNKNFGQGVCSCACNIRSWGVKGHVKYTFIEFLTMGCDFLNTGFCFKIPQSHTAIMTWKKKKLREIDFERKNSLNQCNTVWKWGNFSVTRILREINFCRCVESQNLLFWVVLAPVNFGSGEFLHFVRAEVYSKLISSKIFMAEKMSICNTVQSVEIAEIYSHLSHTLLANISWKQRFY